MCLRANERETATPWRGSAAPRVPELSSNKCEKKETKAMCQATRGVTLTHDSRRGIRYQKLVKAWTRPSKFLVLDVSQASITPNISAFL